MMSYYFVKKPLFGIAAGRVERFGDAQAGRLMMDGSLEPYDAKRHGRAPGAECVPVVDAGNTVRPIKH